MFEITLAARDHLEQELISIDASPDEAMRFTRRPDGWKLSLDHVRPDDTTCSYNNRLVLLMDTNVSREVNYMILDVSPLAIGPQLRLNLQALLTVAPGQQK